MTDLISAPRLYKVPAREYFEAKRHYPSMGMGLDLALSNNGLVILSGSVMDFESPTPSILNATLEVEIDKNLTIKPEADPINCRRARAVRNGVVMEAAVFCPRVVIIEAYATGSASSHSSAMGEVGGLVRDALEERLGRWPLEVPSTTLKKFGTDSGNFPMDGLALALYKRYRQVELPDEHQRIAYIAARLGLCLDLADQFEIEDRDLSRCKWLRAKEAEVLITVRAMKGTAAKKAPAAKAPPKPKPTPRPRKAGA